MKRFALLCGLLMALPYAQSAQRLEFGLGDRYDQVIAGKRVVVYEQAKKDGLKFRYVALWLTPGWTGWVTKDRLLKIVHDGYTPLLIYYTFGDHSSKEYLEKDNRAALNAWYADIQNNLVPLVNIDAEVLVALEPEFNVIPASGTPLTAWEGWNDVAGHAIDLLHQGAPHVKVGLCPGDWGNTNLEPSMHAVARQSDFIAFPEMRASTDPSTDTSAPHYRDVAQSAIDFSAYLKKTFDKPILFAYLALSSYADHNPRGWEDVQAEILKSLFNHEDELLANGVFALSYFSYYDNPQHATEFFGQAERYFGLKDAQDRPKQAWHLWHDRTRS